MWNVRADIRTPGTWHDLHVFCPTIPSQAVAKLAKIRRSYGFRKKKQLKQTEYKMLPDFGRRFEPVAPGISPSTVRNSDKCQCHGFFHCFVHNYRILQFRGIAIVRD
jgi:hypothetical protein